MSDYDLTARRTSRPPKRFRLVRDEDETGISGVGIVAFGVMFSDGVTVTRWNSDVAQTCVWQSFDEVDAVHGHGGRTRIEWLDALQEDTFGTGVGLTHGEWCNIYKNVGGCSCTQEDNDVA